MKSLIKHIILKILKRLGDVTPIQINWRNLHDHKYMRATLDTMRLSKFYNPKEVTVPKNKKILILSPHPDDETIGAGGTILKMVECGCDVHVLQFTLGDKPEVYEESLKVPEILKFTPHYLRFAAGRMEMDEKSLKMVFGQINDIAPDVIFIPFLLDDNEDHRRVNEYIYKGFIQNMLNISSSTSLWAYQVYSFFPINATVRVTDFIEEKSRAMRCYQSQFCVRDWVHFMKGLNAFNIRFLTGGHIGEEYVEVFFRTSVKHYSEICATYFGDDTTRCYSNQYYQK